MIAQNALDNQARNVLRWGLPMTALAEPFPVRRADMDARLFGPRLRELRDAAGWNQTELADRLGVAQRTVSSWERGDREPALGMLVRLAEVLAVDLRAFFEPAPKRKRK